MALNLSSIASIEGVVVIVVQSSFRILCTEKNWMGLTKQKLNIDVMVLYCNEDLAELSERV